MNRKSDQMTTILEEMTWIIFGTNAATFSMLFLCSTWEDEKLNGKEIDQYCAFKAIALQTENNIVLLNPK